MDRKLLILSCLVSISCLSGCSHKHSIVIDPEVNPGCFTVGLTKGSHCEECGEIIEPQQEIPSYHDSPLFAEILTTKRNELDNGGLFLCPICSEKFYKEVSSQDIGLPILSITGDFSGISKDNKKKLHAVFEKNGELIFDSDCTLKWQGASSLSYPKKNYNITLFKTGTNFDKKEKVELVEGWGKQSKYTLKANYVDYSQLRNVVSGKLYGKVVHSRNIDDEFDRLINGGAIDGFPVFIFENGAYQGLYTFNTPKDKWLFGMDGDENSREALLMCNDWTTSGALNQYVYDDFSNGWELEYSSTEDSKEIGNSWVSESFNQMIDFVKNIDGDRFKSGISKYINVERAIDSMLFTWLIHASDNVSKNILWVTYDGVKWQPSVYDLDGVFGLVWDGSFYSTEAWVPTNGNKLWEKLCKNFKNEVKSRYFELRETVLSIEEVVNEFKKFNKLIPLHIRDAESVKWPGAPSQDRNNFSNIKEWINSYFKNMDVYMDATF